MQLILFAVPPGSDGTWEPDGTWVPTNITVTGRPDAFSVKFIPMGAFGGVLLAIGAAMLIWGLTMQRFMTSMLFSDFRHFRQDRPKFYQMPNEFMKMISFFICLS